MEIIKNDNIPSAKGHYSMAIEHNGTIYIAGQLPTIGPDNNVPDSIEEQTKLVLTKIKDIAVAAGSSLNRIIQVRIYISNIELWGSVNSVYADFFGDHKPVRVVVPSRELHYGCLIEAEAITAL